MVRGKYLRERKAIRVKRRIKLLIILAIISMLYRTAFNSYSLFESEATTTASIDVAFYVIDDEYDNKTIVLDDMEPGDVQYVSFSVSNFIIDEDDEQKVSETDMSYTMKIRTTTNLPLEYELYRNQSLDASVLNNILDESYAEENYQDSDFTYFKKLVASSMTAADKAEGITDRGEFYFDNPTTVSYILKITLPETCTSIEYQDRIECVEITVEGKQILDDD